MPVELSYSYPVLPLVSRLRHPFDHFQHPSDPFRCNSTYRLDMAKVGQLLPCELTDASHVIVFIGEPVRYDQGGSNGFVIRWPKLCHPQ